MFLVLKKFDWEGKFIVDPDSSTTGASVKLFSVNSLPHPWSDVEKLTLFHYKLGSFSNQENIFWTLKALQNSCDKELPMITDAKMLKYKASESFGPLYYYELVQQMTDMDSKSVFQILLWGNRSHTLRVQSAPPSSGSKWSTWYLRTLTPSSTIFWRFRLARPYRTFSST